MQEKVVYNDAMSIEPSSKSIGLEALRRVVEALGVTKVASVCGRPYQTVQQWLDPERKTATPAEFCPSIERVSIESGLDIRCEDLRPDVEWQVVRGHSSACAAAVIEAKPEPERQGA